MSNVELKLKNTINDNDIYDIYIDNVYAGGLEANYDPRINSFYIENIKKSDSYKAGHLLEDVVNYLYNEKGYDLGCLPLEKYRSYYEELGFTPFIHHGNDIFYHKIHNEESMKTDEFLTKSNKRHESITENNQLLKVLENTESVFNSIKAKLIEQGFKNLKVNVGDWSPLYKKVMFYINYSNKFSYEQTKVIKKLSSVETIDQIKITIEDDIWEYNTEDLSAEGTVTFKIECPYSEKISNKDAEVIANIFVDKVKNFMNKIYDDNDVYYHKIHKGENMKTDEFLIELKNIINEDLNEGRNLIPDIIEKYGDLTIPEFIDELIKKEENDENILNESINENIYRTYYPSKKATELLISLIKTNYKYIKVETYLPKNENYGYLNIDSNIGEQELHGAITAEFLDKSEQTASWVVSWGSHSVGSSTRQKSLFNACAKAFPDYVDKPSSSYSWDNVTFYTNTTLGRKTDSGEREAIKDLANQLNNIISEIDDIMGQESIKADKELEEIEKARIQAKQNQTAQKTTVKQALSKSAIAKKIMSLQNPTPEQLAKILAAIE